MKILKKIILGSMLTLLLFANSPQVFAAGTLMPEAGSQEYCDAIFKYGDQGALETQFQENKETWDSFLGCAIQEGRVEFWMVKYIIAYMLEFVLSLAALIAIAMIIIGAYFYIAGGLTDDKEKGKTIIKYAIGGLVLATVSWVLVNVLLLALSS